MPVWALPVQELHVQELHVQRLHVQRLLVLARMQERSTQQGQLQHLAQRAWVLVQASRALHRVLAGFRGFQWMDWPAALQPHFLDAARLI